MCNYWQSAPLLLAFDVLVVGDCGKTKPVLYGRVLLAVLKCRHDDAVHDVKF